MIKLYQFPTAFGVPNPSPFCVKVEVLLKMAGLDYESIVSTNPGKGPKGKLPAIEDKGKMIGDSEFIRLHIERQYGIDFDKGLDGRERAVAHAFARLFEERTYWALVYSRWIDESNWPKVHSAFFGSMPPVLRTVLPAMFRKKVRGYLNGHGIGRHSQDEIYALGVSDIRSAADWLGEKHYFMGEAPTGVDATVYAFTENLISPPHETPMKAEALRHANVVAYTRRMRERYFG
ncbi:MAG TPA: glutathione S-transferase family protein [Alphaproteobacteria bacterium]|nr:glutathione S-transferase family protein [Alphaproteobacteria bacterium]